MGILGDMLTNANGEITKLEKQLEAAYNENNKKLKQKPDVKNEDELDKYKATDLTPKEITQMQAELKQYKQKLADGRVFELPCAVGDTVYRIQYGKVSKW